MLEQLRNRLLYELDGLAIVVGFRREPPHKPVGRVKAAPIDDEDEDVLWLRRVAADGGPLDAPPASVPQPVDADDEDVAWVLSAVRAAQESTAPRRASWLDELPSWKTQPAPTQPCKSLSKGGPLMEAIRRKRAAEGRETVSEVRSTTPKPILTLPPHQKEQEVTVSFRAVPFKKAASAAIAVLPASETEMYQLMRALKLYRETGKETRSIEVAFGVTAGAGKAYTRARALFKTALAAEG